MTTKQLIADTLPSGWKIGKLKYFYKFETGFTPPTTRPEYYTPDGEMWVTIADMCNSEVTSSKNRISKLYADSIKAKKVPRGSLLYSFKLSLGKTSIAGCDTYTNEAIASFSSEKNPCINFLKYSSCMIEDNALENIYGAKLLNRERIENAIIVFPPIKTQERIAEYLDKRCSRIDECIKKLQAQLQLVSSYRQSLITRAVTKGKNSKGFDAVSYVPFSAIFSLRRGLNITRENYQEEGVPCLSYGDVHSRYLGFVDAEINPLPKVSDDFVLTNPRCLLKTGEFVFADTSEDYKGSGDCTCVMNSGDGIFAGYHTTVASPTKRNICSQYYGYYFLSDDFRDQVRKEVKGVKVFSITNTILNHAKVLFPPLKDQEEIARFLDVKCSTINKIEQKIYKEIEKLKEYRSSLISAAVTGT